MGLEDYSIEELREEIKRRNKIARQNRARNKPKYIRIEGVVEDIRSNNYNKSFLWKEFKIRTTDNRVNDIDKVDYYRVKNGCFKKDTIPRLGDIVIISHRLTKARNTFFPWEAKIVEVIKRKED